MAPAVSGWSVGYRISEVSIHRNAELSINRTERGRLADIVQGWPGVILSARQGKQNGCAGYRIEGQSSVFYRNTSLAFNHISVQLECTFSSRVV